MSLRVSFLYIVGKWDMWSNNSPKLSFINLFTLCPLPCLNYLWYFSPSSLFHVFLFFFPALFALSWRSSAPLTSILETCQSCLFPHAQNPDTGSSSLHPLSVAIPPPAPHLPLQSPAVWTLGWQAPVERYGDCEVGTQDESRSNLPQGEVDSVDVEVHQAVPSQYGAFSSLSLAPRNATAACCLQSQNICGKNSLECLPDWLTQQLYNKSAFAQQEQQQQHWGIDCNALRPFWF